MSWSWSSWYVYIFFTISTSFAISAWWSQHNKAVTSRVIPIIEEGVEPDVLQHLLGKVQSMKSYGYPTDPAGIAQKDSISTISTPCSTCPLNQFSAKKIKEIRLGFNCQGSVALRRSAGSLRMHWLRKSSLEHRKRRRKPARGKTQWIPMDPNGTTMAQRCTMRHDTTQVASCASWSPCTLRSLAPAVVASPPNGITASSQHCKPNYPNSLKWVVWQFNTIHANCPEFISIIKYSCLSQTNLFSHQPLSSPTVVVCHRPVKDQSSPVLPSDAYPFLHRSWVLRTRLSQIFTESWTNLLQKCNENKQTMANNGEQQPSGLHSSHSNRPHGTLAVPISWRQIGAMICIDLWHFVTNQQKSTLFTDFSLMLSQHAKGFDQRGGTVMYFEEGRKTPKPQDINKLWAMLSQAAMTTQPKLQRSAARP